MFSVVQLRRVCPQLIFNRYQVLLCNLPALGMHAGIWGVEVNNVPFPRLCIDADGQQLVLLNMATRLFLIWSA